MKTIILLLITATVTLAQTTQEEYNYLTEGYKEQLEKGLDVKRGYKFGEGKQVYVSGNDGKFTFDFKPLIREVDNKVAAISVRIQVDKAINSDIFLCIPIDNPELQKQFEKTVSKKFVQWLGEAYSKASSQVIADLYTK